MHQPKQGLAVALPCIDGASSKQHVVVLEFQVGGRSPCPGYGVPSGEAALDDS